MAVTRRGRWLILTLVGPLLAFVAIWWPLLAHYWVPEGNVDEVAVEAARQPIDPRVRDHLEPDPGEGVPIGAVKGQSVSKADLLLTSGRVQLGSFNEQSVTLPFDPGDLERGNVTWRLHMAALVVPRLFMDAYRESGQVRYLEQARAALLGFARFEEDQWLPRGLLWNDHAIAARVRVIARFWQLAREHPDLLDSREAREVLGFAARALRLTAKPGFYNPRTNHGIFQDLALWLGHQAFPGLSAAERGAEVAYARFRDHLPYYVSDEGVTLEHSAGYHRVGVALVGRAFWFMDLAGQKIRDEWWARYRGALCFYDLLERPGGTLPRFGDTHPEGDVEIARKTSDGTVRLSSYRPRTPCEDRLALYPVAGYAVDWRGLEGNGPAGRGAQTVLTWSDFPMEAHKHADELGLHFWADDVDWWTSVGYWPYGTQGREAAVGWGGSNAPHYAGESADSKRNTTVAGKNVEGDGVRFLDLERAGPEFQARRQVVSLPGGTWAVIDSTHHRGDRATREVWRTAPDVTVDQIEEGKFVLQGPRSGQRLIAWFEGAGTVKKVQGGNEDGVVGMLVDDHRPVAATSLVLRRPSGGQPTVVSWRRAGTYGGNPEIANWTGPERWELTLPGASGSWSLQREGHTVVVESPAGAMDQLRLREGSEVAGERREIVRAYETMKAEYGGFRPLVPYRVKTTWVAGALFLLHLLGLPVLAYLLGSVRPASFMVLGGWGAYVLWLHLYYFPF
jgi:hypothetical protein